MFVCVLCENKNVKKISKSPTQIPFHARFDEKLRESTKYHEIQKT